MNSIIEFFHTAWKGIKTFFNRRHHLLTIPLAMLLFFVSVPVLRWIDPTAATFDSGIFQIALFVIVLFYLFLTVSWYTLKWVFGSFYKHLTTELKSDFKNITAWQRLLLSYSAFFVLFLSLVLLTLKLQ